MYRLAHVLRAPVGMLLALLIVFSMLHAPGIVRAAGTPAAILDVPAEQFIGEDVNFTVAFDNTSTTDTGYGPYFDVIMPKTGADGDDGLTFTGATYLGQPVVTTQLTFPGPGPTGCVNHPYAVNTTGAAVQVCGKTGDTLVVLQLPFGSFTPDQPPAVVKVNATMSNLADLGTPLTIQAQAGFQYGNTPLNDFATDPTIIQPSPVSASVTPILLKLKKIYVGPEDETATGPNFPRKYIVQVDVANGQTITNLDLTDLLPNNLAFLAVDSTTRNGSNFATTAIATPPVDDAANPPSNVLTRRFASVTGTTASDDAAMTFSFYVPHLDADGTRVIDPVTGDDVESQNQAKAVGDWTPIDPRDAGGTANAVADPAGPEHTLIDKSIAIQKSVASVQDNGAPGISPADVLEYTLDFQVSDFFAFDQIVVTDKLSDGLRFDSSFAPTLLVNGHSYALAAAAMNTSNYSIDTSQIGNDTNPATNGSSTITFRVSDEISGRGADAQGRMVGGCLPVAGTAVAPPYCKSLSQALPNDGGTTGVIVFRAVIQRDFSDTYEPGTASIDQGDKLQNDVTIRGRVLGNSDAATPSGEIEEDTSGAGVEIARGALVKTIYATNGVICSPQPCTNARLTPAQTVTYRLRYDLPLSSIEGFFIEDYLPLPVLKANDPDANGTAGPAWIFNPAAGPLPPSGVVTYGPADTFHLLPSPVPPEPTVTSNATANSLKILYGNYAETTPSSSTIDLLLTVTASADPFTDGLFLTNQARAREGATNNSQQLADSIVQIKLTEPVLGIKKGVVATNNAAGVFAPTQVGPVPFSTPGSASPRFTGTVNSTNLLATPINSDVSNVDAGDLVTFALVVENTGRSQTGAFDVQIRDTLPAGFAIPGGGLNLSVTDGTGAALAFTDISTGLFDPAGGIQLTDGATTGALARGKDDADATVNDGKNIAIITYDLVLQSSIQPSQTLVNTGTLFNYASAEGGPDYTPTNLTDVAFATTAPPKTAKTLVGTEINNVNNGNTQAVIGEIVTYNVTLTVPEGTTSGAKIVDTLDAGLAFVDMVNATQSTDVSFTGSSTPAITNSGGTVTFDFGTITNTNTDNSIPETITLTYRAVVLDVAGNQSGTLLNNVAAFSWSGGSLAPVSAANVTVIEPTVAVTKSVVVDGSGTSGDAGDPVQYTITIGGVTGADAFDLTLNDVIPAEIVAPSIASVTDSAGTYTAADFQLVGSTLSTVGSLDLPVNPGRTITIVINGTLKNTVTPGQIVANTATTQWSSLDGTPGQKSTYNTSSTERTGAGGVDDYTASSTANITIFSPAPVKTLISTSEAHTSDTPVGSPARPRVAVGEIVRFRLAVRIAEGSSPSLVLRDDPTTGLRFLNDGTAKVGFVSNDTGGGITSSDATIGSGPQVTGNSDAVVPTFVLPNFAVSSQLVTNDDTYVDGTPIYIKLGDLTNNDSDADSEYVVVELNMLVSNTVGNSKGTVRSNGFSVFSNGTNLGASTAVDVTIAEPTLTLAKTIVAPAPSDAGDTVTYQLKYTNANGVNDADAFDINLLDTLNSNLTLQTVVVTAKPAYATATDNSNIAANQVSVLVDRLNKNDSVTVTVTARVKATASNRQAIPNTGTLTYTSLPGAGTPNGSGGNATGSATPGTSGSATGERNGQDGVGGALNKYAASSTVSTTLAAPTIAKQTPSPAVYTIGDLITYYIRVTLPEGVTRGLVVQDTLPSGLGFVSQQVITTAAASAGNMTQDYGGTLATPTVTQPGGVLTLAFGDTTTTDDNNTSNNRFVVQVVARVLNVSTPLNQRGSVLANSAALTYKQGTSPTDSTVNGGTVNITVNEPQITTIKSVNPASGVQAGSILTYVARFTNTGNSTAYDVTATDTLAQGTGFTALTSCKNQANAVVPSTATPAGSIVTFDGSPAGSWDIAPGNYIECTYTATAQSSLYLNGPHTNTVDANWSSKDGSVAGERIYDDTATNNPGFSQDGTQDTATAAFTVAAPTFGKSDGGTTEATIGQPITYTLTITSPIGTIRNLAVVDTLPAGLVYDASFTPVISGISPAPAVVASSPNDGSAAVTLTWTFGDAAVASSPATIRFQARVADVAVNNAGLVQTNSAALTYNNAANTPQPPLTSTDSFTVVEPRLAITKNIVEATADAGQRVNVTLTVTNTGTSDSFDTIIADTLDAAFDSSSVLPVTTPTGFAYSMAGTTVTYTGGTVAKGATLTFTFSVRLANGVLPGAVVPNSARVTQATTLPGPQPGERNEPPVTSADTVTINSNSLGGFVYVDANNDGVKDGGETPIESVLITLTGTDNLGNTVNITTTTDVNGAYTFPNLRPGTYQLTETQPAGYGDGKDTIGTPGGTTGNDTFTAISLPTGTSTNGTDNNFGEVEPASLSGFVYVDANNDGVKDSGEAPIENVLITLTGTDDLGATVTLTTTTDVNGAYTFPNLRPGTYTVTETQPSPYLDGKDTVGTLGGNPSNDQFAAITLASGTTSTDNNFGELEPASLSGFVYNDVNDDGVKDASEAGIGGALITLTGIDDLGVAVSQTATTDSSGAYSFPNLRPGTYQLVETQPAGYGDGKDTIGTPGGTATDDQFAAITLVSGTAGTDNNFGELFIPAVAKTLLSTSAASTTGSDVTIGEVARYELKVELLKGTLKQFTVQDFLPTGIQFLPDNAIEVAYDTNTPVTGFAAGTFTNATNSAAVSSQLGSDDDTYGDGTPVYFKLGDITNNDSDANKEYVIIRFDVLVLNTIGNQDGTTLANTFGVLVDTDGDGTPGYISVDADGDGVATGTEVADDPNNNGSDAGDVPGRSNSVTATLVEPTLTISKAVSQPSANAGDLVTYTLTITNSASAVATAFDAVISDTVPAGLTYEPGSITISSGPSGTPTYTAPNTLNWRFPAIAPGETAVLTFGARVDDPALASITNVADVIWTSLPSSVAAERDGSGGVNDYRASDQATLDTTGYALSKTLIEPAGGLAGVNDTVRFSIVVTNTGVTDLATVPLDDTYNAAVLQFVSANPSPDATTAGTLRWDDLTGAGSLAPGATLTVEVTFTAITPTATATINRADVAGAIDTNSTALPPISDTASVVIGQPDLRISKTDGVSSTVPGATLTYTLTITNSGTYTATGVLIDDLVPVYTSYDSDNVGWDDLDEDGTFTYTLPAPLGPGESISVTFLVNVDATVPTGVNTITNTATVQDDGAYGADPTPGNNSATDIDALLAAPDLALVKTHTGDFFTGRNGAYTLQVTNNGTTSTTGPITITDTLPNGLSYVAASGTGWSCTTNGQTVTCAHAGPLDPGDSLPDLTLTVAVGMAAWPTVTNSATVTTGGEGNLSDNSASDLTMVRAPDLQLEKQVEQTIFRPGGTLVYTLAYTNTGNQDANGVIITETVPEHTSLDTASSTSGWTCADFIPGSTCTFAVGAVVQGTGGAVKFAVTVDNLPLSNVTMIMNTAQVTDDHENGDDPTDIGMKLDNNQSSVGVRATPTAVTLINFTAAAQNDGVRVQWETSAELNTTGFRVLRGSSANRAEAIQITPEIILARGRGQNGARYSWLDAGAQPGAGYRYWLVEVADDGTTSEYGPVTITQQLAAQNRVFLPMIGR